MSFYNVKYIKSYIACVLMFWIPNFKVKVKSLSRVRLFATPWTEEPGRLQSMGFFQARVLEWVAIAFPDREEHGTIYYHM